MVWSPGKTHSPVVLGDRNSDRNHKWIRSILQDMDATGVMWTKPKDCRDYLSCGFMEANGSKWIQMDPNGTPLQHGFPANHHCHHWDELLPLNFIELPYYHWITIIGIIGMPITHGHYASLRKKKKKRGASPEPLPSSRITWAYLRHETYPYPFPFNCLVAKHSYYCLVQRNPQWARQ